MTVVKLLPTMDHWKGSHGRLDLLAPVELMAEYTPVRFQPRCGIDIERLSTEDRNYVFWSQLPSALTNNVWFTLHSWQRELWAEAYARGNNDYYRGRTLIAGNLLQGPVKFGDTHKVWRAKLSDEMIAAILVSY